MWLHLVDHFSYSSIHYLKVPLEALLLLKILIFFPQRLICLFSVNCYMFYTRVKKRRGKLYELQTLTDLKCVLGDTRQTVVQGAPCSRVDDYFPYFICLAKLRRPLWLHNAHQS